MGSNSFEPKNQRRCPATDHHIEKRIAWLHGYTLATTIIINRAHSTPAARAFTVNPTPFRPKFEPSAPTHVAPSR
ncbi:MAG: hypothetical protein RL077_2791 [Verrucomicrobiota bacterium]|jgi:hypothetical protein